MAKCVTPRVDKLITKTLIYAVAITMKTMMCLIQTYNCNSDSSDTLHHIKKFNPHLREKPMGNLSDAYRQLPPEIDKKSIIRINKVAVFFCENVRLNLIQISNCPQSRTILKNIYKHFRVSNLPQMKPIDCFFIDTPKFIWIC